MTDNIELLTVTDLMKSLKIGRDKAYSLMRSSCFPSIRLGKTYLIQSAKLNEWLNSTAGKEYFLN